MKSVVAINKSTDALQEWPSDARVKYEIGAELNAQIVVDNLDRSIAKIEEKHYSQFIKPINIYVLANISSVEAYCISPKVGACVSNQRLFISPKPENTPQRIPRLLLHELSHLHLEQHLGLYKSLLSVPSWYSEGLAVYTSDGAGAENISKEDASNSIIIGKTFEPVEEGSILFPKTARDYDLKPHMFYRQSEIFVNWLHDSNPEKFKRFNLEIQNGKTLGESVLFVYGITVKNMWEQFVNELKTNPLSM